MNFPPPTGLLDEHETVAVEVFDDDVVVFGAVVADDVVAESLGTH